MKALMSLLILLVLCSAWPLATGEPLPCEASGLCSRGITKRWVGDIKDSSHLKAMLEAVSYKKELIISSWSSGQGHGPHDQVLQLHYELLNMGYSHFVVVVEREEDCTTLAQPEMSCVWDSTVTPQIGGLGTTLMDRWKLPARAARLGINMLCLDADFIIFSDPYIHLRQGKLASSKFIYKPEGWHCYPNTGFAYIQNVRPDGPITWVLMDTLRTQYRRADDGYAYVSQWTGSKSNCIGGDQEKFGDALCSTYVGRPFFLNTMQQCKPSFNFSHMEALRNKLSMLWDSMPANLEPMRLEAMHFNKTGLPFIPDQDQESWRANITIPNLNLGYAEELGGRMFADEGPRPLSDAWEATLRSDCPSCPWWNEYRPVREDHLIKALHTQSRADMGSFWQNLPETGVPQEEVVHPPQWLIASLPNVRRGMMMGRGAPRQGYLVMGHVHAWHIQVEGVHKTMLRKILGRFNWTLGAEVAAAHGQASPYLLGKKVTRVLALHPSIDLSRTRSWAEFSSIIAGLYQVAYLSRRTLVLPNLPCQTAWLHEASHLGDAKRNTTLCLPPTFWEGAGRYPLPMIVPVDGNGELVGGWARRLAGLDATSTPINARATLMADASNAGQHSLGAETNVPDGSASSSTAWWSSHRYVAVMPQLWDEPCTAGMHGIIAPEYHHWLKHDPAAQGAQLNPSFTNTILAATPSEPLLQLKPPMAYGGDSSAVPAGHIVPPSSTLGWSWYDVQAAVAATEVVKELIRVRHQPVVYVGHPVMVVSGSQAESRPVDATAGASGGHSGSHGMQARLRPDLALNRINEHMQNSKCKALWELPETIKGTLVNLNHGIKAVVQDYKVMPA